MKHIEEQATVPLPSLKYLNSSIERKRKDGAASAIQKYVFLLLVVGFLLYTGWQVFLVVADNKATSFSGHSRVGSDTTYVPTSVHEATKTLNSFPIHYQRPDFQAGIVFPQWSSDAYGPQWQQQLPAIQEQTGARWIEMPILFSQSSPTSTYVTTNESTPAVQSITAGISSARSSGYHVFVVPLLRVDSPSGAWAASISFSTYQDEEHWFDSYWQALQPYIVAAAQAGADQVAIGTEIEELQQSAPPSLWNTLIARVRGVFSGSITYDMNWTSLSKTLPAWMRNSQLAMIGVSEYLPLETIRARVEPNKIMDMWRKSLKSALDNAAVSLGKPILISEIGYRNSADALYQSWLPYSTVSPTDSEEQAAACNAALANVVPDSSIAGIFFWGWDNVGSFKLSGQPAVKVLHKWYTSPLS